MLAADCWLLAAGCWPVAAKSIIARPGGPKSSPCAARGKLPPTSAGMTAPGGLPAAGANPLGAVMQCQTPNITPARKEVRDYEPEG